MATLVSLYGVALAPKVSYGRNNFDALSYTPKAPESPPGADEYPMGTRVTDETRSAIGSCATGSRFQVFKQRLLGCVRLRAACRCPVAFLRLHGNYREGAL